jgi:hypothetical protein
VRLGGTGARNRTIEKGCEQVGAGLDDPTNPRKPRYVKARERVAAWVRGLGVTDPELSPNHAWRHAFKAVGFRCDISENGARRYRGPRACFGRTWIRRADACG